MKPNWHTIRAAIAGGYATDETFTGAEPEHVRAIKATLPFQVRGVCAPQYRTVDKDKREVEFRASVEIVDRMGDLILIRKNTAKKNADAPHRVGAGFKVRAFQDAGAPVLWNHNSGADHALPPIGQVLRSRYGMSEVPEHALRPTERKSAAGKALRRATLFQLIRFEDEDDIPYSKAAYLLVTKGVLRAVSVGFVPVIVDGVEDEQERRSLGLGPWGVVFRESDQLELSLTPTPANPMALVAEDKTAAQRVDRALQGMVERGEIEASLVSDFRRVYPASPAEARARLAAKLRSFIDLAADLTGHFATEYEMACGELLHEDAPSGPERAEAGPATDPAQAAPDGREAATRAATPSQGAEGPATPDRGGGAPLPAALRPGGSVGPGLRSSPIPADAPLPGVPIQGVRMELLTTDDGRAMRLRVILPAAGDQPAGRFELTPLSPEAPIVAAVRAAIADAVSHETPDERRRALGDPYADDVLVIDAVGDAVGAEDGATREQVLDMVRSLVVRDARRRTDLELVAESLPQEGRARCLKTERTPGQLARLLALEVARLAEVAERVEQYETDAEVPTPTADVWRAFDLLSESADRLGRFLDAARGLPGAERQRVRVATQGVDSGSVGRSPDGKQPRRSVEPQRPTESTRASGTTPPATTVDSAPAAGGAGSASDRRGLVDRARDLRRRLDDVKP